MRGAAWVLLALLIPAAAQKDSSQRSIGTIDWGLGASDNTFLASSPAWTARSAHYVASFRPSEEKAAADIVAVRVLPRRLVKLDDVEQTYTLDAQLQVCCLVPAVAHQKPLRLFGRTRGWHTQ